MSGTAGVVTSGPSAFTAMVESYAAPIPALALASRSLILDVFPRAVEVVWAQQRTAGYGTGPKKRTEQFCWLAPFAKHVVFGFYYATELPDPEGLLEGTGRLMRHVKIRRPEDLERPALRALVVAASTHRVPPLPD
jgi:Domain of unknown function (DU1801)